jgi:signal transduction histidine kinase
VTAGLAGAGPVVTGVMAVANRESVPWQSAVEMPADPDMSARPNPAYIIYAGRYRTQFRALVLIVLTALIATSRPTPGLHGHSLVILVSLTVAVLAQVFSLLAPHRWTLGVVAVGAVSAGVLVGFDPATSVALLIFIGLEAGAMLELWPGMLVVAAACLSEALATLAAGKPATEIAEGLAAIAGFLAATTIKQYSLRIEEAEMRAADVERAAGEHALAVRLSERANAAREIHDILAHSLGALVLQLDAVDALLSSDPVDLGRTRSLVGRSRLLAVEGLTEARRAVGTLRQDALPIIDTLRQLVDTTGTATLEVAGAPRTLPNDVSLAVHRTAQEGLTNAAKHAAGSTPLVRLRFDPEQVVLTVTDGGPVPGGHCATTIASTGGGYGVEGLRERARLLGGTLTAGPAGRGWEVMLRVPLQPAVAASARP